jgi:hypothetical protein
MNLSHTNDAFELNLVPKINQPAEMSIDLRNHFSKQG